MAQQTTANQPGLHLFRHKAHDRPAHSLHDDEGPGLLASPAFWLGGVLSIACWVGLAAALGVI